MQAQHVRVKLLAHRNESGHGSYTQLAGEDTDEMHEPGKRGGLGGACQHSRLERFQNDAAYQTDIGACESGRKKKLD